MFIQTRSFQTVHSFSHISAHLLEAIIYNRGTQWDEVSIQCATCAQFRQCHFTIVAGAQILGAQIGVLNNELLTDREIATQVVHTS